MYPKVQILTLLGLTLTCNVQGQDVYVPPKLRVTSDATCAGGGKLLTTNTDCAVLGDALCDSYGPEDMTEFPKTANGGAVAYISGADIYTDTCKLLLFETDNDSPTCGQLIGIIEPDTPCREYTFPANFALGCCCGSPSCDAYVPEKRRGLPMPQSLARRNRLMRSPRTAASNHADERSIASARSHARDLGAESLLKTLAMPKKRQDECRWVGNPPNDQDGDPQTVSSTLSCPPEGDSCAISNTYTVSTSQTNSFGASAEIGASLFEIVQVSVSFSYEYSYTEERSESVAYTVNLGAGQRGYLVFYPTLECSFGHFEGSCDVETNQDGNMCVPKYLNGDPNGQPSGTFRFIEELRVGEEPPM